jgi:hypothetical protein
MGDRDLEARVAVEQSRQDHAGERQLVELVLVHLPLVADRHARRMDEQRDLARLGPLPEREGVLGIDEAAVPARADQQSLEAELPRQRSPSPMWVGSSGLSVPRPHRFCGARSMRAAI